MFHHQTGRLQFGQATFHAYQNTFGNHDGVIHQHPQSDDQRPQGDPLQVDGHHLHEDEGAQDSQQQHAAHQHPGTQAHEYQQHGDHNGHRFTQVEHEGTDRLIHFLGLVIDSGQLHTHRTLVLQFLEALIHPRAHIHHIDAGGKGNTQGQGRAAIESIKMVGNFGIPPLNGRHITQVNQLIRTGLGNQQVAHGLDRGKLPGGINADVLISHPDLARRVHGILGLQQAKDAVRADPQRGQPGTGNFHQHLLLALATNRHLANPFHQHQVTGQIVSIILQLLIAVTFTGNGHEDAVNITKVIDYLNRARPWRQLRLQVGHLVTQLIPDLF